MNQVHVQIFFKRFALQPNLLNLSSDEEAINKSQDQV